MTYFSGCICRHIVMIKWFELARNYFTRNNKVYVQNCICEIHIITVL
jgi:hypothetical protein